MIPSLICCIWSYRAFNTLVDIKLKHWADSVLPKKCTDVGWETLRDQFLVLMNKDAQSRDHDTLFEPVKRAIVEHAMSQHVWDPKAVDYLVFTPWFIWT